MEVKEYTPKPGCKSSLFSPRKCCKGAGEFDYFCVKKNLLGKTCTVRGVKF